MKRLALVVIIGLFSLNLFAALNGGSNDWAQAYQDTKPEKSKPKKCTATANDLSRKKSMTLTKLDQQLLNVRTSAAGEGSYTIDK